MFIGEKSGATSRRWYGKIDDVGIWRRALSPTEIANICSGGTGNSLSNLLSFDSEGLGMPDWWRLQYFGHTNAQAGDLSRTGDDPDGDGLTNLQEYQAHAPNPMLADTDGDGLTDSQEPSTYLMSPTLADTDGDGMTDNVKLRNSYNALVAKPGIGFGLLGYFPMDAD